MNDDYLWDRTGEPDPEIQQLEDVLGTLRYLPHSLELPPGIRVERPRHYFWPLAIAAAVALTILAAGLWVRFQHSQTPRQGDLANEWSPVTGEKSVPPINIPSATPSPANQPVVDVREGGTRNEPINHRRRKPILPANSLAANRNRHTRSAAPAEEISSAQREVAQAAKDQLILALRLASAKLNLAQRKTQGPPAPGTIRNQHKVG